MNDAKYIPEERLLSIAEPTAWSDAVGEVFDREQAEEYVKLKEEEKRVAPCSEVAYLNESVFQLLREALIATLLKVKEHNCYYKNTDTFNGLDYLSEYLYNKNPNHPERVSDWKYIFDIPWVEDYLKENPRPCYPLSLVWSRNFAALKIQSYIRGHWVRCRPNVQELRQFWKTIKEDRQKRSLEIDIE